MIYEEESFIGILMTSTYLLQVKPWAFEAILQYLYTDRLYIEMEKIDDCIRLARQCKLEYLRSQLEVRLRSIQLFGKNMRLLLLSVYELLFALILSTTSNLSDQLLFKVSITFFRPISSCLILPYLPCPTLPYPALPHPN